MAKFHERSGGDISAEYKFENIPASKKFVAVAFSDGYFLSVPRKSIHVNTRGELAAYWGKGSRRESCTLLRTPTLEDFFEGQSKLCLY